MSFEARYHGECGFCGEEMKGTDCSYAPDGIITHTGCLIPYSTGVDPIATVMHRNEKRCGQCFQIHAGECL